MKQTRDETAALMRLAAALPVVRWRRAAKGWGCEELEGILGIGAEEVRLLFIMGALNAINTRGESWWEDATCTDAELLRFLREHGEWWFEMRLEKQIAKLEEEVEPVGHAQRWSSLNPQSVRGGE